MQRRAWRTSCEWCGGRRCCGTAPPAAPAPWPPATAPAPPTLLAAPPAGMKLNRAPTAFRVCRTTAGLFTSVQQLFTRFKRPADSPVHHGAALFPRLKRCVSPVMQPRPRLQRQQRRQRRRDAFACQGGKRWLWRQSSGRGGWGRGRRRRAGRELCQPPHCAHQAAGGAQRCAADAGMKTQKPKLMDSAVVQLEQQDAAADAAATLLDCSSAAPRHIRVTTKSCDTSDPDDSYLEL